MESNLILIAGLGLLGVGGYFAIRSLQAGASQLTERQKRERAILDKKIAGDLTLGTTLALADELGLDDWLGF